jgi:AcrR family transcriptional regulator
VARPARAREHVLDAAEELFLTRGYESTQLDRVCEQAGVSKGAIFYHFDTKEALAAATLERFFLRLVADAQDAVEASVAPTAVERLFAYVDAVAALTRTPALARGCLLGMLTMECAETCPPLADRARQGFEMWHGGLAALIREAASERGLDLDAAGLATTFLAAVEGGLLLDRQGAAPRAVELALDHFRRYLALVFQTAEEVPA